MGWRFAWKVTCDNCKTLGPLAYSSTDAERKAVKRGWLYGNMMGMSYHLCPKCVTDPLPDWWPADDGMHFHWEVPA